MPTKGAAAAKARAAVAQDGLGNGVAPFVWAGAHLERSPPGTEYSHQGPGGVRVEVHGASPDDSSCHPEHFQLYEEPGGVPARGSC